MKKLFCVASGQLSVKKENNPINRKNRYLNYGLLSLASTVKQHGIDALQIQGDFSKPYVIFEKLIKLGLEKSQFPLLLSVPSFYAVSWTNELLVLIKKNLPNITVIIGGRWVIDGEEEYAKQLFPNADIIIPGLIGNEILDIIGASSSHKNNFNFATSKLDYSILVNRDLYQPALEVSRGCGMKCHFCQEKDEPLQPLKSGKLIIKEAQSILKKDTLTPMNLYFEASMFKPTEQWIREFELYRDSANADFLWRTEARVDNIKPEEIVLLSKVGLRVLDLGLESADSTQLVAMGKTKKPRSYLEKASKLIQWAYDAGVQVKINILLYPGETESSIKNTIDWLELHKEFIKGVSVGPVIIFGWPQKTRAYIEQLTKLGARVSHSNIIGVQHLDLSDQISHKTSIKIAKQISKMFMSDKDYYDLKSFSYFPRDYSYSDYLTDLDLVKTSRD